MKGKVIDEQAMNDGVDLPESVEVSYLEKIGIDPRSKLETYSITVDGFQRLAQVQRRGNKCIVKSLYSTAFN